MLNDIFLRAISWTLIHSIWQGILLAFLSGIVIMLTRKSAALRYNLIAGLFVGFLVSTAITFRYEIKTQESETTLLVNFPITFEESTLVAENASSFSTNISQQVIEFLNANANLIAIFWFVVFCIRSASIFAQMRYVYKIRNYKNYKPSQFWQSKIIELSIKINLRQKVQLLESSLIKVPSVTGIFKPILLVPVGLLANLPIDQVEAILLHELAHIQRKDYAMNLLQSFAEMLFFFNPGLLWVSSILHDERENCCDDIAIDATENKSEFIRALLSFEDYQHTGKSLAMGFGGSKNHLLNRARRVFNNDNASLNQMEKSVISLSLLVILSISVACSNAKIASVNSVKTTTTSVTTSEATTETQKITTYPSVVVDEQIALADAKVKIADQEAAVADAAAAKADALVAKSDARIAKQDAKQAQADIEMANADQKMALAELALQKSEMQIRQAQEIATRAQIYVDEVTSKSNGNQKIGSQKLAQVIIAKLLADKIIATSTNLSYLLSDKKFIVNGVQQSDAIKAKFNALFAKDASLILSYNNKSTQR